MMDAFIGILFVKAVLAEQTPSPDFIRVIQERDAREFAMYRRIELQVGRRVEMKPEPIPPVEAGEVPGLKEALERFVKEGGDVPDLRK